jgi:Arm DNA-binding domain
LGTFGGIPVWTWGYFPKPLIFKGKMALTDTAIKRARANDRPYRMSDGGGLFLWITPAGGKLWRWKYRLEGLEKLMSFGKYPDVTLTAAREKHGEARKLLAAGLDPMVQRKTEKMAERVASENSFESVAAQWMEHWQEGKSPRHVDSTRRLLASNILPSLGIAPNG